MTGCRDSLRATIRSIASIDDVLELDGLALGLVLGDAEDPPLGRFEQFLGGEVVRVAVAEHLVGALDQLRG